MREHDLLLNLVDKFEDPIILIGGLGRSGTTFCSELFSSHPEICICDEFRFMFTPPFQNFITQIEGFYNHELEYWRGMYPPEVRKRYQSQWLYLWIQGTRFDRVMDFENVRYIGLKTPNLEQRLPQLSDIFSDRQIFFINCLRDPVKVMKSYARMTWRPANTSFAMVDSMIMNYRASLQAIENAKSLPNVHIEHFAALELKDDQERAKYIESLFQRMGIPLHVADQSGNQEESGESNQASSSDFQDFASGSWKKVDCWPVETAKAEDINKITFTEQDIERFVQAESIQKVYSLINEFVESHQLAKV
jgi:hypothetical protein